MDIHTIGLVVALVGGFVTGVRFAWMIVRLMNWPDKPRFW